MSGPVYQLLYMSRASFHMDTKDVLAILVAARRYNSKNAVSGLLLFREGKFLQLLEGTKDVVKDTYERIKRDTRHDNFITIMEAGVDRRLFETWSMAYGEELLSPATSADLFATLDRAMQSAALDQRVIMSILEHFAVSNSP